MDEEVGRSKNLQAAAKSEGYQIPAGELEQLFREHHRMVFHAAYRVTGNAADAEDVLQIVFLRLARREAGADAVENPAAFLRRAAVNASLDLMRGRDSAKAEAIDDVAPARLTDSSPAPDRAAASGETRRWLRRAVSQLSPRAAEMFTLRYFEEVDNKDIARMLGTSQTTVAVTLHRTRERLEQEYRSYMGGKS